ncbi:hypothetical protein DVR12_10675 [Chitinophaga silvatica]|uniref:Uncharacterized protein n=1 Tax=Chitinophaga silvatica TaxID=2282649 RepID=A0A3E1YBU0_9BACT|nr:hypothetical protein [Chitinophaga silvatica]RFS23470.1 hypothetical protein DVR12_10675 [Chitinophaga silvatica]
MKKALTGSLALLLITGFAFAQDKKGKSETATKKECTSDCSKKDKSKTKSCCKQPSKAASLAAKGQKTK